MFYVKIKTNKYTMLLLVSVEDKKSNCFANQ